ncbi:DUF6705 family protein [Aquimarina sp. 2201CG14-23]|uniref:DUF6705 family protein n=1 Tax=Aquimarina mycalae TaxID=3040073 RepID=UPI002477DCE5|nr:DUF6705 family protein [Aquimarina sp. 2201CG14-23]MDH7446342.1 hypothetical protein [Aquimarina sp. 2201CG14-23]
MKTIIKILVFFVTIISYSQEIVPIENKIDHIDLSRENKVYYKDVNGVFNKFIGTWKHQVTNELFEITFRKVEKYVGGNYDSDRLVGRFKFVKNGEVIYDTTAMLQSADAYPDHKIFGGTITSDNLNRLELEYNEPGIILKGSFLQQLYLTYDPSTQQLDWFVRAPLIGPNNDIYPYKIPFHMILTKVN